MLDNTLIFFLANTKLFKGIPIESLKKLSEDMSLVSIRSGEYLLRHGEDASAMYLLFQGRLRVYLPKDHTTTLAEIGVGEVVGELALLTHMKRAADVCAIRDSTLIQINEKTVQQWIIIHPESAMRMIADSIKRLLPQDISKAHPMRTLAIVPAHPDMDMHAISHALLQAILPYKTCKVLSDEDEIVARAIQADEVVPLDYLNACEVKHDLLIYVATPILSNWTKQCFRQADKLLIMTPETLTDILPPIQYLLDDKSILAEKILVVFHPEYTAFPKNTDQLMQATQTERVFHIKKESDYHRLGRFLTGHAISLVLSGGGLRGAAHFGLFFALEEKGIPIDMLGGSSFGGLAAVGLALRLSPEETRERLQWVHEALPKLMDYTLPVAAFLRGERLYDMLTTIFPADLLLEDLWLPTFCTATNLTDADIKILDKGMAWQAVRASISLPAIFTPVIEDGKILVDGATFNNLPADIMRARNNAGKIIGSSVSTELRHEHYFAPEGGVSGLDILMDRFRSEPHTHLPTLFELLLNTEFVSAQKHMREVKPLCDVFLDLNMSQFPLLDLKHWNQIVDAGYEQGCRLIEELGLTRETVGVI